MDKDEGSRELNESKKNFAEWYNKIVKISDIIEHRYPVKGCEVLMPYGTELLTNIKNFLEKLLKNNGNKEVLFPLFIPESLLKKESEHIKGFEEEVYYVTHAGKNKLGENLILRPTSETAIYPMFNLWIRSHKDLPIRIYQTVSVFRYETKMTKPLVRMREVMFFNESHTAHKTWEDAEEEVKSAINIYSTHFSEDLALPFVILKRPSWDTFPGAKYTKAFDVIIPDGRFMQIGTVHNLGEKFAKAFDIKYTDENEKEEYANQTCYGVSTRTLAAVISIHGDDKGLILPPNIAPVQVVIIPIIKKDDKEEVLNKAREIEKKLKNVCRVHLDDREEGVGSKFFDWEIKGVPVRIEIGKKEVEKHSLTITRRYDGHKLTVNEKNVEEFVEELLKNIQTDMKQASKKYHDLMIQNADSKETIKEVVKNKKVAKILLCENNDCIKSMEEELNLSFRGDEISVKEGKCIGCGKSAKYVGYIGRAY